MVQIMSRPKKMVDWEQFDKLCSMQCPIREIASWFDMTTDTLEARIREEHNCSFSDIFEQKRGKGKISIRRKQYDVAMSGNVTMLIWLGKQYLGQADKQEVSQNTEIKMLIDEDDAKL